MKESYKEVNIYEFIALVFFFFKRYKYIFIISVLIGSLYAVMNNIVIGKNVKHLKAMVYSPVDIVIIDHALKIMDENKELMFPSYNIVNTEIENIENADNFGRSSISLHPKFMLKLDVLFKDEFTKDDIDSIRVILNTLLKKNETISNLLNTEKEKLLNLLDQIKIIKENENNVYDLNVHSKNVVLFDKSLPQSMLELQQIEEKYKTQLNYLKPLVFLTDLHVLKEENRVFSTVFQIIIFFFIGLVIAILAEVFKGVSSYKKMSSE